MLIPGVDEVRIWRSLKASEQQKESVERGVDALHRDSHIIPVRIAFGFVRLSQECIIRSLRRRYQRRKIIEDALKENEAKFRSLISNIPGAAYHCKNAARGQMISSASHRNNYWIILLPISCCPIRSAISSISSIRLTDRLPRKKTKVAYVDEYRIVPQDGGVRWILDNGDYVHDESGNVQWLDGFLMDITPRKEMEVQLLQAKENAEFAAKTKSAFLANMSHNPYTDECNYPVSGDLLA